MIKLYQYQQEYLSELPRSCIMAADTGTGKTVMALAHALSGYPILVLAPASKVRTGDWQETAREFGIPEHLLTVQSYEKATRKTSANGYYLQGKKAFWWEQYASDNPEFVLICDEVHKAKNPQSLTGKGVYMLARLSRQFIGLSATPLPNGWVDICNYGKIFGWWKHKTEFWQRHVIEYKIPGQHWSKITGYRDEEQLKRLWSGVAKALSKDEALDLPKLTYKVEKIAKPKIYDQVKKTRVYRAEELDNVSKLIVGLRRTLIKNRIDWLKDFLEGASGHTVVFYNFIEEREQILASIPKGVQVYRQDGERHEIPGKSEWASLPERSVTVVQYKSGGTGIEITYADKIVYLSETYSYADFSQSIGRVYRNGQTKPVTAYLLHTPQTISSDIWKCIKTKRTFDQEIWAKDADIRN